MIIINEIIMKQVQKGKSRQDSNESRRVILIGTKIQNSEQNQSKHTKKKSTHNEATNQKPQQNNDRDRDLRFQFSVREIQSVKFCVPERRVSGFIAIVDRAPIRGFLVLVIFKYPLNGMANQLQALLFFHGFVSLENFLWKR